MTCPASSSDTVEDQKKSYQCFKSKPKLYISGFIKSIFVFVFFCVWRFSLCCFWQPFFFIKLMQSLLPQLFSWMWREKNAPKNVICVGCFFVLFSISGPFSVKYKLFWRSKVKSCHATLLEFYDQQTLSHELTYVLLLLENMFLQFNQ